MAAEEKIRVPRLVIAAASSGSGKTTLTMGLLAALCRRGMAVQPFKVGPDYIDPAFHTAITGRPSINLDGWMLDDDYIKKMFQSYAREADISVIEGVMGFYDGKGDDPLSGSTAGIAKLVDAPVILVLQAGGMAASAAAVVFGMKEFRQAPIAGVVINKPSSPNHFRTVKEAIEKHTGIPVLGFLPRTEGISLESRHLGLVQSSETDKLPLIIESLAQLVRENIDLEAILRIANEAPPMLPLTFDMETAAPKDKVRIAVAWDKAFAFYYHENFSILRRLGAELVFFSPLADKALPPGCQGIYLGGGYPEVFAETLADNLSIRRSILAAAEGGMPIYAECGGYMFLNKKFTDQTGRSFDFVGFFDGEMELTNRLQNFGYTEITGLCDTILFSQGEKARGHEFHKSVIRRNDQDYCIRGEKIKEGKTITWNCGRQRKRAFGMYPHLYFPSNMDFARNFIRACAAYGKEERLNV